MAEESEVKGKRELISNIESDAEEEARRILSQAEKEASENKAAAASRVENILREAGEKAAAQAEAAGRKILSGVEVEVRRKLLQGQFRVLSEVLEKARARVRDMAKTGRYEDVDGRVVAYREILRNWIVEAVIGLGSERAEVSVSALDKPHVDDALLAEAAKRVERITGRAVKLTLEDGAPRAPDAPGEQGVILTDRERRVAFNNRLDTRLRRKERLIQAMIYDALLKGTA